MHNGVYDSHTRMNQTTQTKKEEVVDRKKTVTENIESLVKWRFTEEKKTYTRDKELLVIIVGIGAILLAIITKNYIFGVLLALATVTLISTVRKKARHMLFNITPIGIFMDDDFVETTRIKGFNVIDDPGDRARLILKIERIVNINEIIPIYDVNIQDIEHALTQLEIPREEELGPTPMDHLTAMII